MGDFGTGRQGSGAATPQEVSSRLLALLAREESRTEKEQADHQQRTTKRERGYRTILGHFYPYLQSRGSALK